MTKKKVKHTPKSNRICGNKSSQTSKFFIGEIHRYAQHAPQEKKSNSRTWRTYCLTNRIYQYNHYCSDQQPGKRNFQILSKRLFSEKYKRYHADCKRNRSSERNKARKHNCSAPNNFHRRNRKRAQILLPIKFIIIIKNQRCCIYKYDE